jgi:glycosyltransferase involved in cell wall biosynthesis
MDLRKISVIITSYNEEANIAACLDRLGGFGEIILVDSFSTDRTVEIARKYPVIIFKRPYRCAAAQKNWAMKMTRGEWILILDADELLSGELKEEIRALDEGVQCDGFWIRRRSSYMGRVIKYCGWQRDKVLRLVRRGSGLYEEKEVHEEIVLDGREGILSGRIIHNPYRDLKHHLSKMREYTKRGALEYRRRGGRFAVLNMILHPPFRFLRMYVLQGGFLDRLPGLILCLVSAYGVFLKYAKAREMAEWKRRKQ